MKDRELEIATDMTKTRMMLEAKAVTDGVSSVFPEEFIPSYLELSYSIESILMDTLKSPKNMARLPRLIEESSGTSRTEVTRNLVQNTIGWFLATKAEEYYFSTGPLKFIFLMDLLVGSMDLMDILRITENEANGSQKETAKSLGQTAFVLSMMGITESTVGSERLGEIAESQRQKIGRLRDERVELLQEDPSGIKLMDRMIELASKPESDPSFLPIVDVHPREFALRGAQIAKKAYEFIYPLTAKPA